MSDKRKHNVVLDTTPRHILQKLNPLDWSLRSFGKTISTPFKAYSGKGRIAQLEEKIAMLSKQLESR